MHQIELLFRTEDGKNIGHGFADSIFRKGPGVAYFTIRDEYDNEIRISPRLMYAIFTCLAASYDRGILPVFDFSKSQTSDHLGATPPEIAPNEP